MNRGEIQDQIINWTHRTDLGSVVSQFVDIVTQRLNRRLGITLDPMSGTSGTNIIGDVNPSIYLYGGLREYAIYAADAPAEQHYDMMYEKEVNRLNITYNGEEWDNTNLAVLNELEIAIAEEEADAT